MEPAYSAYGESMSASSEDDDFSTADSSDDSEESDLGEPHRRRHGKTSIETGPTCRQSHCGEPNNLVQKLFNRERTGCFSGRARSLHAPQRAFNKVPNRLGFCLKDIVPYCFLQGHMFMGLSACGQFLLSYKVCCNDTIATNHYSFNYGYKYTLYFWIYQPHKPLRSFYKCCLFDDHGVDNLKKVTMTQWKCVDPRVLIVHGAAEDENEDSYITYVKVPKLGCLDCKKLRDFDDDGFFRWHALCLKCNLTIHTKYSSTESDPKFNSYMNLICPERILIVSNGFMHMLHVEVTSPTTVQNLSSNLSQQYTSSSGLPLSLQAKGTPPYDGANTVASVERRSTALTLSAEELVNCDNHNNIIARIIADFSDIETDSTHSSSSRHNETPQHEVATVAGSGVTCISRKTYDELIFTCNGSTSSVVSSAGISSATAGVGTVAPVVSNNNVNVAGGGATRVNLISHKGKRHHRIVTKSFRNGITTVDLQATNTSPSTSTAAIDKSNAYEFSEDNEKCEKIATLRKRRLADKKYEFSEDNSENIIPFTKIRSASKNLSTSLFGSSSIGVGIGGSGVGSGSNVGHATRPLHRPTGGAHHFHNSPCASPSSSPHPSHASSSGCDSRHCTPPPMHRASPISSLQQGFRSPPCSSPVAAGGIIRSPNRHISAAQIYSQKSPPPPLSSATQQMLSFKPLGALSPLQVSMTKRSHLELAGAMSPNANVPFLSPRREELRVVEVPLQGGSMPEKPVCTKKFKRRYVEEDDAASVITSEEDDCISPGYHTSLPMEVHGSCYSEMQMISQASYQQLRCTSVVITQHSFDLETFTYYTISTLCQKNQKTYDVFYDWACEIISVCPLSHTIVCLLMAQFSARDQLPAAPTNCLNCSRKLDCAFHRRQFECRILFTWNMESGDWEVLDYGDLNECKLSDLISPIKRCGQTPVSLAQTAKKLAHEMSVSLGKIGQDYSSNLRVLDSNMKKSKQSIADLDNVIELHLKRPRSDNNSNEL